MSAADRTVPETNCTPLWTVDWNLVGAPPSRPGLTPNPRLQPACAPGSDSGKRFVRPSRNPTQLQRALI